MTDILCILGRGIEQVPTNSGLLWRPTRYLQLLSAAGRHTGRRAPGLESSDGVSFIAGGHANVLAACQFFTEAPPRLLVFAAGRPPYLEQDADPSLTEGRVMAACFRRSIPSPAMDLIILHQNRNTRDDIVETCKLAVTRGLTSIAVLTVAVHVPRTQEFVRLASGDYPHLAIRICASEDLLTRRYAGRPRCLRALESLRHSRAWARTASREQRGIDALRAGAYDSPASRL